MGGGNLEVYGGGKVEDGKWRGRDKGCGKTSSLLFCSVG